MVLKIFICPSQIANWSLGLLESMGHDRYPIRALGEFPLPEIFTYDQQMSFYLKMSNSKNQILTQFMHRSLWEISTSQKQRDWKVIHILWYASKHWKHLKHLLRSGTIVQTKALILTPFWPNRARGVNRNKRNRYKLLILVSIEWSMHKETILRWGKWSILCTG